MCLFIYIYSHSITCNLNHYHNHLIFILIITMKCSIIIVMWNLNQAGCLYSFWAHSHIYAFSDFGVRHICCEFILCCCLRCMSYAICSACMFWKMWIKWRDWGSSVLPCGRSQCIGIDGVEIDLREIRCKAMGWINLTQYVDKWLAVWIQ